jgi:flagellar hook protein FlgE
MSLSGAMVTAVTGLDAQSRALGNISDNIANSQTVGYKDIGTAFGTLVTVSNTQVNDPGGVLSRPLYYNDIQGSIQQTQTATNLAISGAGMFAVSKATGSTVVGGAPNFAPDPLYTRAGDFALDNQGFLVNSAGYYLDGWAIPQTGPSAGIVQKNALVPLQVTQLQDNPVATQNIDFKANLPTQPNPSLSSTGPTNITMPPQQVTVYDAQGTAHTLSLKFNFNNGNPEVWNLSFSSTDPSVTGIANATSGQTVNIAQPAAEFDRISVTDSSGATTNFEFLKAGDTLKNAGDTAVTWTATDTASQNLNNLLTAVQGAGLTVTTNTNGSLNVMGATAASSDTWDTTTSAYTGTDFPGFGVTSGTAIDFNPVASPPTGAQAGSIAKIAGASKTVGQQASIPVTITYSDGTTQTVNLNLGSYGVAQGLTEFTGTDINFQSGNQDGLPPGSFQSLSFDDQGMLTLNYTNGNKKTVFQVPIAKFENYDGLQSKSGNAYTSTAESGVVSMTAPGANGSGTIVASGVEESTVDISAEFTKMITAQRAYSANSRVITVTNELFQDIEQVIR